MKMKGNWFDENFFKDAVQFCTEWLDLEKYDFKIISTVAILAGKTGIFIGTIKDICNALTIANTSPNRNRIKESLDFLNKSGYIDLTIDKNIYKISFIESAKKSKKLIGVMPSWYELIKSNHGEASWGNVLRVFIKMLEYSSTDIVTYADIGNRLKISDRTDKTHYLRMPEILSFLEEKDIYTERRIIYSAIALLNISGFEILGVQEKGGYKYHHPTRKFDTNELKFLIDSVASSKFLTERKSKELINKIKSLGSIYDYEQLNRNILLGTRIKSMNDMVLKNLDNIYLAINNNLLCSS